MIVLFNLLNFKNHVGRFLAKTKTHRSFKLAQGFAFIEVLITLLLLAITVSGMISLLNVSLLSNKASANRVLALQLAQDMADRIRANPVYAYQLAGATAPTPYSLTEKNTPTSTSDCAKTTCNWEALAKYDVAQWRTQLEQTLPNAQASIEGTNIGPLYIVMRWSENVSAASRTDAQGKLLEGKASSLRLKIPLAP